MIQFLESLLL